MDPAVPLALYAVFFAGLLWHVLPNSLMFRRRYGRRHRLTGLFYLSWLAGGLLFEASQRLQAEERRPAADGQRGYLLYDVILGALGIALTWTAASDFSSHRHVRNSASGALDKEATITVAEMVEHGFYQGLNLAQALFLHSMSFPACQVAPARAALLALVTLPWSFRSRFPVNRFSANYKGQPVSLVGVMYRLKKYQYVFYKHWLLHGLNISVALGGQSLAAQPAFRLYWLSLNAAYVLEFFLQTLVKKGYMQQGVMLRLNQLLMVITTAPALSVLRQVDWAVALVSVALNFLNRGRDVVNVAITAGAALSLRTALTLITS